MKLFNRISLLLISSLVFAACERDYDAPPLNEPKYDGPAANTTIEELRAMGATVGKYLQEDLFAGRNRRHRNGSGPEQRV